MDDDGFPTETSHQQKKLEYGVSGKFEHCMIRDSDLRHIKLLREEHAMYLEGGLESLNSGFVGLDASRPWLCYWILHSLSLLGTAIPPDVASRCIAFLQKCQDRRGGFGGGPGQMPHLAPTYAAVAALVSIGGHDALKAIDRPAMLSFLLRMKDSTCGSFRMHEDGESDVRGCYTAIAVAHLLNMITPELVQGTMDYICKCQTYEGGLGGEPGVEAHGGYSYCGLAAAMLLGEADKFDLLSLLDWAVHRQPAVEGGFQGRTNKLVDGCYSFWQGALIALFDQLLPATRLQSQQNLASNQEPPQSPLQFSSKSAPPQSNGHAHVPHDHTQPEAEDDRPEQDLEAMPMEGVESAEGNSGSSENTLQRDEDDMAHFMSGTRRSGARRDPPPGSPLRVLVSALSMFPCPSDEEVRVRRGIPEVAEEGGNEAGGSGSAGTGDVSEDTPLFNTHALQAYLLMCCQDPHGGMKDKPGKPRDFYHTCYCLSGLSMAQHSWAERLGASPPPEAVVGLYSNLLKPTEPLTNVIVDRYDEAIEFFGRLPMPQLLPQD